ncbi:MAG TPA: FecR domain-containing protein [Thermodesulfovibrionales bacterium]|nr:FecR domain-containing protein [Thermodesulfovibrionales bacterium]
MKKIIAIFFLFFIVLGDTAGSQAAPASVGIVRSVSMDAYILRDKTSIAATINMKIVIGDVIRTGPTGSIGLIFDDDTLVSMGPNSEFAVEGFLFSPSEKKLSFVVRMLRGTFSYLSGQISKLLPGAVRLETPDATIGMRGTHVLVKVEER